MNVAVALGRLGHTSHLLTRIGDDQRGQAIRAHVTDSHVQLTPGSITGAPTSTAEAQLDASGAATYTFDLTWDPAATGLPEQVHAVHTSSIAAVLDPGAARERIEAIIVRADVVKTSDEDVAWLYDTDDVEDVVSSWRALGPGITVLTRGGDGAVGFTDSGRVQVAPVQVEVADTVGAGDTFSAGILDALADKRLLGAGNREALAALPSDDVAAVLRRAARLAAVTVSRSGANPPWSHELG